jgi:hypothetical protein
MHVSRLPCVFHLQYIAPSLFLNELVIWMTVFRSVATCSIIETARRFRSSYCLHHQGDDSVSTSETSVNFYETARRNTIEKPSSYSPTWELVISKSNTALIQCFSTVVRGGWPGGFGRETLRKLYETPNELKIHPYTSVLKVPLLVDLQQEVGELALPITSYPSIII